MTREMRDILDLIDDAKRIGVVTHIDGDGDAFGAMLGLARVLETVGKEVVVFSREPLNYLFDFIAAEIEYHPRKNFVPVDLVIGVDANIIPRFSVPEAFKEGKRKGANLAVIDHHLKSDIGDFVDTYWCDPEASSASEMIYRLATSMHLKLDKTTATLLLLGIETDTFSLQFENSKPRVFLAVADLLKQGARLKPVVEAAFGGKPLPMAQLLGRAIERVIISPEGVAVSYVSLKDKEELGLADESVSGVANFLDQIKEAKVVMAIEEQKDDYLKVSLRSNNSQADVARFASFFGGGGHKKAAAFRIKGKLSDVLTKLPI